MSNRYFNVSFNAPEFAWLKANVGRAILRVQNMIKDPEQANKAKQMLESKRYKSLNRLVNKMDKLTEEDTSTDSEGSTTIRLNISRTQARFIQDMCKQISYQMDEKVIPEYKKRVKDSTEESIKEKNKRYLAGAKGVRNVIDKVKSKVERGL